MLLHNGAGSCSASPPVCVMQIFKNQANTWPIKASLVNIANKKALPFKICELAICRGVAFSIRILAASQYFHHASSLDVHSNYIF